MPTIQQCVQLLQSGQVASSIQHLKQLLATNVKDAEAHQLLGVAYIYAKEYKLAEKHLLKCLKLVPNHLDAKYNLARLYTEQNKLSRAKQLLAQVLKVRSDWPQARFAMALVLVGLNEPELAIDAFKAVLKQHPENTEVLNNLGKLFFETKDYTSAKSSFEDLLKLDPNNEAAVIGYAEVMLALGLLEELTGPLKGYAEAMASARLYAKLASVYRLLGKKGDAKSSAARSIELGDLSGDAHKIFYDSSAISSEEDLESLSSAIGQQGLEDSAKAKMHFSMSSGLEACGLYDKALVHLNEANLLLRKSFDYSISESIQLFEMLKKAYSKKRISNSISNSNLGKGQVFIVGMPRSGTSLIEQIIASHSNVYGAGELEILRDVWKSTKLNTEAKFHMQLLDRKADELEAIGQRYVDAVKSLNADAAVITDKLPHNFLMIGLIAAVLPKAQIIHCKRHPIANCLSIYKADFRKSHGYAFNQKELAEYHNLYEDLMDHWREVMPGKFYEIKYEDLTSNQEEETRKLIEYCGLEWEDACLDFHKNKRAVKTASAYQVRQKMHNKSVDLWKRYGDGLKTLIDNLYIPEEYKD